MLSFRQHYRNNYYQIDVSKFSIDTVNQEMLECTEVCSSLPARFDQSTQQSINNVVLSIQYYSNNVYLVNLNVDIKR